MPMTQEWESLPHFLRQSQLREFVASSCLPQKQWQMTRGLILLVKFAHVSLTPLLLEDFERHWLSPLYHLEHPRSSSAFTMTNCSMTKCWTALQVNNSTVSALTRYIL